MPQKPTRPTPSAKNETGDFDRFKNFVRHIVNVRGSAVKQQIENEKKARSRKRAKSSSASDRASRAKD